MKLQGLEISEISSNGSPEKNLLSAILLRAWADLDNVEPLIQKDAYNWIDLRYSNGAEKWSFIWICDVLGLESSEVRNLMLAHTFTHKVQKLHPYRYKRKES